MLEVWSFEHLGFQLGASNVLRLLQAIFKGLMNFERALSDWLILFWQVSSTQLWDDLMNLLIAGLETLAAVLTWTFYLLAQVFYISCKFCIIFLGFSLAMLAVQPMGPQLFSRTLAHEFCEFFYIDSWVMFLYSHRFRVVFLFLQNPASTVSSPLLSYGYNCRRFHIILP
jgi:hypothetical protein